MLENLSDISESHRDHLAAVDCVSMAAQNSLSHLQTNVVASDVAADCLLSWADRASVPLVGTNIDLDELTHWLSHDNPLTCMTVESCLSGIETIGYWHSLPYSSGRYGWVECALVKASPIRASVALRLVRGLLSDMRTAGRDHAMAISRPTQSAVLYRAEFAGETELMNGARQRHETALASSSGPFDVMRAVL